MMSGAFDGHNPYILCDNVELVALGQVSGIPAETVGCLINGEYWSLRGTEWLWSNFHPVGQ